MVKLEVVIGDVTNQPCDLLVLKHADGFNGVDQFVASRIGFTSEIPTGEACFAPGRNIEANKVLFVGVGPLTKFRYTEIRRFASRALKAAYDENGSYELICTTIHGPGYGLDEREAFLSLIGGFLDAIENGAYPSTLQEIRIVERNAKRANRLQNILRETLSKNTSGESWGITRVLLSELNPIRLNPDAHDELSSFGAPSEKKPTRRRSSSKDKHRTSDMLIVRSISSSSTFRCSATASGLSANSLGSGNGLIRASDHDVVKGYLVPDQRFWEDHGLSRISQRRFALRLAIYLLSRNPRPAKIFGIAFSIRAVGVADCFASVK